ncbi:TPA: hypothetical protein QDB28_004190 [Burkholderia vietnamiensis]|nr:hypothetical protein [Burkholderia vietnamiensis]
MAHPTPGRGTFIKLRGILDIASRDPKWAADLKRDVAGTIRQAGLDFSSEELEAVADLVNNTSNSRYATDLTNSNVGDKFPELRRIWANVQIAP